MRKEIDNIIFFGDLTIEVDEETNKVELAQGKDFKAIADFYDIVELLKYLAINVRKRKNGQI